MMVDVTRAVAAGAIGMGFVALGRVVAGGERALSRGFLQPPPPAQALGGLIKRITGRRKTRRHSATLNAAFTRCTPRSAASPTWPRAGSCARRVQPQRCSRACGWFVLPRFRGWGSVSRFGGTHPARTPSTPHTTSRTQQASQRPTACSADCSSSLGSCAPATSRKRRSSAVAAACRSRRPRSRLCTRSCSSSG